MKLTITDTFLNRCLSTHRLLSNTTIHRDIKLIGFGVRITNKGSVSFIVEIRDHLNQTKRKTLGKYPILSTSEARVLALRVMKELKNPLPAVKQYPTLLASYKNYLEAMNHRPKTVHDYENIFSNYLMDWANVSVNKISDDMVISKYLISCEQSIAQANKSMKLLQAVLRYSGIYDNPVLALSQRRLKKQLKPKTSYVPLSDLNQFYDGLSRVKDPSVRLYLELLLHTGLRANEAMQITKDSVSTGVLIIRETKNHSDHRIPITRWLSDNLLPFLISYPDGFTVTDVRKSLLTASQFLTYTITRHDLRRTFASYASESGCDYLLIKRALNHSINDITARYIQTSPSSLAPVFEAVGTLIEKNSHYVVK